MTPDPHKNIKAEDIYLPKKLRDKYDVIVNDDASLSLNKKEQIEMTAEKTLTAILGECECCGHILNDGCPADTEFNKQQANNENNNKQNNP